MCHRNLRNLDLSGHLFIYRKVLDQTNGWYLVLRFKHCLNYVLWILAKAVCITF